MAAAARDENEKLNARIAALEAKGAGPGAGTAKRGGTSRGKAGA
jgi:BMFP domain-containing protein YqiC